MITISTDDSRARRFLGRATIALITVAARRRQGYGTDLGTRVPATLAAAPVALGLVVHLVAGGAEQRTALGYKTALRRVPPVLSRPRMFSNLTRGAG